MGGEILDNSIIYSIDVSQLDSDWFEGINYFFYYNIHFSINPDKINGCNMLLILSL